MALLNCLGVIPSRYPSTRLPAKPLKDIGGKTLLQRVWEQANKSELFSKVVIATDDQRIMDSAASFGGVALMTSPNNATGSDRVAEVARMFSAKGEHFDLIANVQGDMPFLKPQVIDQAILALAEAGPEFGMSTICTPILTEEEYARPSTVKVALGTDNSALYFSRSPIPHWRDRNGESVSEEEPFAYKHMGLYVFRPETLRRLASLEQTLPELREKLEQLRALCNGVKIKVAVIPNSLVSASVEVDTPDDLERAREIAAGKL